MSARRRLQTSRRGVATIETALCAPVLLAVLSGVLDWGWFLSRESELVEAVRDAARVGAAAPAGSDPMVLAEARLSESLSDLGFSATLAVITIERTTDADVGSDVLSVAVSLPHSPLFGLVLAPDALGARVRMPVVT